MTDLGLVSVVLAEAWPQIMTDDEWRVILLRLLGDLFLIPKEIRWLAAMDSGALCSLLSFSFLSRARPAMTSSSLL